MQFWSLPCVNNSGDGDNATTSTTNLDDDDDDGRGGCGHGKDTTHPRTTTMMINDVVAQ